jgi:hypothetical protein
LVFSEKKVTDKARWGSAAWFDSMLIGNPVQQMQGVRVLSSTQTTPAGRLNTTGKKFIDKTGERKRKKSE